MTSCNHWCSIMRHQSIGQDLYLVLCAPQSSRRHPVWHNMLKETVANFLSPGITSPPLFKLLTYCPPFPFVPLSRAQSWHPHVPLLHTMPPNFRSRSTAEIIDAIFVTRRFCPCIRSNPTWTLRCMMKTSLGAQNVNDNLHSYLDWFSIWKARRADYQVLKM